MSTEINFLVGGEAGQGVQSVGFLLARAFARGGYHVFADQDYESRVRGGHNFFRVRVRDSQINAIAEPVDILIALNKESIELHQKEVVTKGVILCDGEAIEHTGGNSNLFRIPLGKLAEEAGGKRIMANTVALGASLGLVHYGPEIMDKVLLDFFGTDEKGKHNVNAARAGYEYARRNYEGGFAQRLSPIDGAKRMLLHGNEAIALGAITAGCKFMAAYPMTPATSIMEYLASKAEDFGLVMVHAEDEIAAMNMAVGAGYAGVRAMTATSGSGFCLMVEGLGLAGITETPVVVIDAQRPGPAVGLPTRNEQGDLQFVLYAHHGDFPRAVLAPGTVEDAFWLTVKAFNMAEKYQLPVILLTDHHLATSYTTVDTFDTSRISIERGELFPQGKDDRPEEYKRHKVTESGVSPRAFPGQSEALVVTDSDEHDEAGHLTEDVKARNEQVAKRMRKLVRLGREVSPPQLYGPDKAQTTLVGWGSTYGSLREAVDILSEENTSVNMLHLNELYPFPAEAVAAALENAGSCYVIESNATGQLARLIRAETGIKVNGLILRYDGRPFTPAYIAERVRKGEVQAW